MQKKHRRIVTLTTLATLITWGCSMVYSQHTIAVANREIALAEEAIAKAKVTHVELAQVNAQIERQITEAEATNVKINHEDRRRRTVMDVTGWSWDVSNLLIQLSDQYGFTVDRILGVISNETGGTFDASLVSHYNADGTRDHGLMQINDGGTLQWLGEVVLGNKHPDPYDAGNNLEMGMWYLNHLNQICQENWECTKSRYNGDRTGAYARRVAEHTSRMGNRLREAWGNNGN